MADEQMTPEEAAALANYLGIGANINLSGTSQINAVENLAGLSDNLLAQALLGYLNAEDIGVIVQGLMYEPYEGQDPLLAQQEINVALRAVGENLGLAPETLNELALSVAGGTPADVALATISGSIFRDEEGASLIDVPQADAKDFDLLGSLLSEYGKAARLEDTLVDFGGQKYSMRSNADVRKDMADLGLTGEFNDPSAWMFQPDQTLQKAATDAMVRSEDAGAGIPGLREQLDELAKSDRVAVVSDRDMEQGIRDFALLNRARGGLVRQGRSDANVGASDATNRPAGGLQRRGRSDANVGAAESDREPLFPSQGRIGSTGVSRNSNRQLEQDLKAAQRYATFAAAEEARKQAAPRMDDIRQQITQASAEQNLLSSAARKLAQDAVDEGSYAGDAMISNFRNLIAGSLPTQTKQGGGSPARISLSDDVIRNAARSAAAPYLRSR